MTDLGVLIVSHSNEIALGCYQLVLEAAPDLPISYVGGTEDGGIGTSFSRIQTALEENPASRILAFYDLGSARMNLEMVCELTEKEVEILPAPLIEGAYTACALLQAGVTLDQVLKQLAELSIPK